MKNAEVTKTQFLDVAKKLFAQKGFYGVSIAVTSRKVVWLLLEQLRLDFVPVLHRLQGRPAAQG